MAVCACLTWPLPRWHGQHSATAQVAPSWRWSCHHVGRNCSQLQGQLMQMHARVRGSHQLCHQLPLSAAKCVHMACAVSHVLGAGCASKERVTSYATQTANSANSSKLYPVPDHLIAAVNDVLKLSLGLLNEHRCKVRSDCSTSKAQVYRQTLLFDTDKISRCNCHWCA